MAVVSQDRFHCSRSCSDCASGTLTHCNNLSKLNHYEDFPEVTLNNDSCLSYSDLQVSSLSP